MVPNKGEHNQKWLPHPCLPRGPKEGGNATSPLHSRGSPTPSVGSKIRSGCLTPAFLGAKKWADMLHHPWILGGSQRQARGAKSEVATSQCRLLGSPKESRNATPPLHSRGSPAPSGGSKIRSGPQQRGTKSELAASPRPSRGHKRGRKCYGTPAFSGVPNAKHGEQNQWSPAKGNKIRSGCLTPAFPRAQKRG